ncbi:Phosphoglucomutase/phosphomannomutase, partial [Suhomyces tanzawaensis NRRL Y-17324]
MSFSSQQKAQLDQLVQQWLAIDRNPHSINEIKQLHASGNYSVLDEKLSTRIAFGTAGLRSEMTLGFAHMNDVTILQASQGLVQYVLDQPGQTNASLVVGYDHRFHSQRFAEITASVALTKGVKVYYLGSVTQLSDESVPESASGASGDSSVVYTPLVPFSIDKYGASAGVMVTASHNPAKDNGYKVYYGNGCQIIPPHDDGIAASIDANLQPWLQTVWDVAANFAQGLESGLLVPIREEASAAYVAEVTRQLVTRPNISTKFTYTPVHGVGLEIFDKCISNSFSGYEMKVVSEQAHPDPNFPTVKFPNPEEKGALHLSIQTADKLGHQLVLANDPDADRFSVAVKSKGQWRQLTGNEIGFLFAMYIIEEVVHEDQLKNTYLLNSTVSSQVLNAMAEKKGFHFQDTLTGFKWIGNRAIDYKKQGFNVPFAYEEAIGYMFGLVNDKDGVSAAVIWLQLYDQWFSSSQIDPIDKLNEGYEKYGWFKECNGYYKLNDLGKTKEIFDSVRGSFKDNHPETIGEFKVIHWRDLTIGYESSTPDFKPELPVDPKSQMITAVLKRGDAQVRFTCRGSGTEPKLKVYIEGRGDNEEVATQIARDCWDVLKAEWFHPEANGLEEHKN